MTTSNQILCIIAVRRAKPGDLAYTTTETGLVTVCLMIALSGYLLIRRGGDRRDWAEGLLVEDGNAGPVFRTAAIKPLRSIAASSPPSPLATLTRLVRSHETMCLQHETRLSA
jgi:hypothetical protein